MDYSIKKGRDPAPLRRCGSLFFRVSEEDTKSIREYGIGPFSVAVIHGGPGASGEMAPVAKELALVCGIIWTVLAFIKKKERIIAVIAGLSSIWVGVIFRVSDFDYFEEQVMLGIADKSV